MSFLRFAIAAGLAGCFSPSALAHAGRHPLGPEMPGWTFDPAVTLPLGAALLLWVWGYAKLRHRARGARPLLRKRALLFLSGWSLLAASLISPLHEAGERSFTLHMIEHEIIMLIAAPLLVLAKPLSSMSFAIPRDKRRTASIAARRFGAFHAWKQLSDPLTATLLQIVALFAWHVPELFDRAVGHIEWHVAQHLSFLATALLFWSAMLKTRNFGAAAFCLFVTSLAGGALGALMSLAGSPWYASYASLAAASFGLSPQDDQAMAGLIMWIPGGLVHAGAALWMLARYLDREKVHVSAQS